MSALSPGREALDRSAMALSCAVIWGGQSVAVKLSVMEWPPFAVMAARFLLASLTLGVLAVWSGRPLRIDRSQVRLILGNVALLVVQIALFTIGTGRTTSARSVVLVNTFPFFAALACHFLTHDALIRRSQFLGLLLAFSGLIAVFSHQIFESATHTTAGDLLVLAAAAVIGLKIAYVRRIVARVQPIPLLFWSTVAAGIICITVTVPLETHPWQRLTPTTTVALCYQGCLGSAVAAVLWTVLLERNSPNTVTVFRLTSPPLGVFFSWLILSEQPSPGLLAGCVLIVVGILCVNHRAINSSLSSVAAENR